MPIQWWNHPKQATEEEIVSTTNATVTAHTLNFTACPSHTLQHITHMSCYNIDRIYTWDFFKVVAATQHHIASEYTNQTANQYDTWDGHVWLTSGQNLRVIIHGTNAGDDVGAHIQGEAYYI